MTDLCDPHEEAIRLVTKAKPLFLVMHLWFRNIVSRPPKTSDENHEGWAPPTHL